MEKLVLLPLDERPCNTKFPKLLFDTTSTHIVCPPQMGDKKKGADCARLARFLREACAGADGLVLSLDMLLYGGLIPSRLHGLSAEELAVRLETVRQVRRENPSLKIFAFQCIMRCPTYSSSEEEPDYYARCGKELHALGVARHRLRRGETDEALLAEERRLTGLIPPADLEDYLARRAVNLSLNLLGLELVEEGVVDFLVVPQDDAAPLGFTALDQAKVRLAVREKKLGHKVLIYPGADELAMTLLTRMKNELANRCPAVYLQYACALAPSVVPPFEDRPLDETLWYQLTAARCRRASSPESADLILAVTAPPVPMAGSAVQPRLDLDYDVRRSLPLLVSDIARWLGEGRRVAVLDNAYCNGGDLELLSMLDAQGLLMSLAGYAGWNTSANSAGTAIAMGVRYLERGADQGHLDFMALRYVEDCGYDALVRQRVDVEELSALGFHYYDVGEADGAAAECVKRGLENFVRSYMPSEAARIRVGAVRLPWRRMFEPDIDIAYIP